MGDFKVQIKTLCGGCKATGAKHEWNDQANLVQKRPYERCPACNGSGYFVAISPQESSNG